MEKGLAHAQMGTQTHVSLVTQIQDSVAEECEQVEQHHDHGEVVFAMPEVVFEVIAIVLEHIVVFVLDFPARTTRSNNRRNVVVAEGVIGGKGVVVEGSIRKSV